MSRKSARIAEMIESCRGQALNPHYLGYFKCFNEGLYFEAHDVLEEMWLPVRKQPEGDYYKGLIQLAGAFVHLQKDRLKPANALFALAFRNLSKYPDLHEQLDLRKVISMIQQWQNRLTESDFSENPLTRQNRPHLELEKG